MRINRLVGVIVVIAVIFVGAIAALSLQGYFKPSTSSSAHVDHFTIVEQDPPDPLAGMNGSYYKSPTTHWPVIQVHLGDTVIITVINNGSSEPHGFAIDHYFNSGISTAPGKSNVVTFVANVAGTFRMYCSVFCSIHPLMQNGELIVASS